MRHLATSIEVEASAEQAWELISEFAYWPTWGPTVNAVESESTRVGPGVTGSVVAPLGVRVPFVITDFVEGESWSWDVGGVAATGHSVASTGEDRCRVEFSVPAAFFPYMAVLRIGLRRLRALAEEAV